MNVREAAKRFDEIRPDWFTRINFETLDMNDCLNCILGQVFGHYDNGIEVIFGQNDWDYYKYRNLEDAPFGYKTNIQLWKDEVNERKMSSNSLSA